MHNFDLKVSGNNCLFYLMLRMGICTALHSVGLISRSSVSARRLLYLLGGILC